MKKVLFVLMFLVLIASLFISCNNSNPVVNSDNAVASLSFSKAESTKTLSVAVDSANVKDLYWFFTAVKNDAGPNTGATASIEVEAARPVCPDSGNGKISGGKGLAGYVVSPFSIGSWKFALYAYTTPDPADGYLVYTTTTSNYKVATVAASMITNVKVNVDSVSTDGKGKLIIGKIGLDSDAKTGNYAFSYRATRVGENAVDSWTNLEWVNDTNDASKSGTTPTAGENLDSGDYKVEVKVTYTDNTLATSSITEYIIVSIYNDFKTTVSGSIDNLTGGVEFDDPTEPVINNYTVKYDANLASSGSVPVDNNVYQSGDIATVSGNTGDLAKDGYVFAGWAINKDGSGTVYGPDNTETITVTGDIILYAKWAKSLFVTYDANGANGGNVPTDATSYKAGDTANVKGNSGNLDRDGYMFAGWSLNEDGSGIIYGPGNTETIPVSSDITLYAKWAGYLTFAGNDAFTLSVRNQAPYSKSWDGTVEYSTDKSTWTTWEGNSAISAVQDGTKYYLYLRGKNTSFAMGGSNPSSYTQFVLAGGATEVACSGNIMSLLDYLNPFTVALSPYCFGTMFEGCSILTEAPSLPATTLAEGCYMCLFMKCSKLTKGPELPATVLAKKCYLAMFKGSGLTEGPELPATTLAEGCYSQMFAWCQSLTKAPELPVTALANSCYDKMFAACTSLKEAPVLPATTLVASCYNQMFAGCSAMKVSRGAAPGSPKSSGTIFTYSGSFSDSNYVAGMFGSYSETYMYSYTCSAPSCVNFTNGESDVYCWYTE